MTTMLIQTRLLGMHTRSHIWRNHRIRRCSTKMRHVVQSSIVHRMSSHGNGSLLSTMHRSIDIWNISILRLTSNSRRRHGYTRRITIRLLLLLLHSLLMTHGLSILLTIPWRLRMTMRMRRWRYILCTIRCHGIRGRIGYYTICRWLLSIE